MNLPPRQLDDQLGELTTWTGASPELWKRALESPKRSTFREVVGRILPTLARHPLAATVILGTCLLIALSFHRALDGDSRAEVVAMAMERSPVTVALNDPSRYVADRQWSVVRDDFGATSPANGRGAGGSLAYGAAEAIPGNANQDSAAPGESARSVIRKATVEFTTPDVRAAYFKTLQTLSEARGEYAQESSLTGEGDNAQASLTLRVAADRLSAVLSQLRELGDVQTDTATGEDVTAQVVDLDARLHNEERVEKELLELLDKRNDAPLKEILELRDRIASIRGQIESLTAQQQRLSRLVSLASILVIIRAEHAPAPEPVKEKSFIGYLTGTLGDAAKDGSRTLADTLAGFLNLLIGGLVWWALLLVLIAVASRVIRRRFVLPA